MNYHGISWYSMIVHGQQTTYFAWVNNIIWALIKLKAFADNKFNFATMLISLFDRVENIMGKGDNADYQHFLLYSQCFQEASFSGLLKDGIVW